MTSKIHLKGLNGIRAIAALSVVIFHTGTSFDLFGLDSYFLWGKLETGKPHSFRVGAFAVTIFFTLSGFLITYLLLKEREIKEINIRNFYIRRILRIWPLYFLILIVTFIFFEILGIRYRKESIIYYLLFIVNIALYSDVQIKYLGFYWSLCVEEQFYLLWPVFIKLSKDKYMRNTLFLLSFLLVLRGAFGILKPYYPSLVAYNDFLGLSRFHTLLMGALAAMLFYNNNQIFIKIFTNKYVVLGAWITIFLPAIKDFRVTGLHEIISLSTIILIISQICNKNKWINLENKTMDFLGKISYSIYMTHVLVILLLSRYLLHFKNQHVLNYFIVVFLVIVFTILVSTLSYLFFEKWFLNYKKKYAIIEDSEISKS